MKKILFVFCLVMTSLPMASQTPATTWSGELHLSPQISLKLVFHVAEDSVITMDSPDQGAYGIECVRRFLSADSLNVAIPSLMLSFAGHRVGEKMEGLFRQRSVELPLTLTPGENKANRPQTPHPPFPYQCEEVIVDHDDVTLAGTLTVPKDATTDTPVVVMVTGSGLQNRDEELFEHKPFAVIADYLARNGIASLRYDDRGVGGSKGDFADATTEDFARDAEAMVSYLRQDGRFEKIGILGHSEGGLIAYKLGARPGLLDFIVSVAGPSVRGDSILVCQNRHALVNAGIPDDVADNFASALGAAFKLKIEGQNTPLGDSQLEGIYPSWNDSELTRQLTDQIRRLFDAETSNPWLDYFMSYSPADDMRALRMPALIIYGGKDTQVPAKLNAPMARSLAPAAMVKVYPYANHLMQHSLTGEVEEYQTIDETISPEVLSAIRSFIKIFCIHASPALPIR